MEQPRALPLHDLHPYKGNPRRGNVQAVKESLEANGQFRPIVVNATPDGYVVLAGNHTLQALKELHAEQPDGGWGNALVHVVKVGEERARAIMLADNRTGDLATYDNSALLAELAAVDEFDGTGWTEYDLAELMELELGDPASEPEADPFPYPGMRTVTLNLMEPLWEQWTTYTQRFDSPEEALEHLLDHGAWPPQHNRHHQ